MTYRILLPSELYNQWISFLWTAVQNPIKFDGFIQQTFIVSQFWWPKVQNWNHHAEVKMLARLCSFWRCKGNPSVCLFFPVSRATVLVFSGSCPLPPSIKLVVWQLQVFLYLPCLRTLVTAFRTYPKIIGKVPITMQNVTHSSRTRA